MATPNDDLPSADPLVADQLKRKRLNERVRAALAKQNSGEPLNNAEENALRKHQLATEKRHGTNYLRRIPQKDYCQISGRTPKVLYEQGDLYGFDFRGEFVDGAAAIRFLHQVLVDYKHWFSRKRKIDQLADIDEDDLVDWADRCLEEKFYKLRDERREREEQLLPADVVHEVLGRWSAILRTAGDQIAKINTDAHEIFNDALDDCEQMLADTLRNDRDQDQNDQEAPA